MLKLAHLPLSYLFCWHKTYLQNRFQLITYSQSQTMPKGVNSLSMHIKMHYPPTTTHPTAFHNPSLQTNKYKAYQCKWQQNGTRCRDGVKVLPHLVWLVFEASIPTCACFPSENFLCLVQITHLLEHCCDTPSSRWQRHSCGQLWTDAKCMYGVQMNVLQWQTGKFTYTKVKHNAKQKALFLFLVI